MTVGVCNRHGEFTGTRRCRQCAAAYRAKYRANGQLALAERRRHLKESYGLSLEDYDAMVRAQRGRCAICRRKPPYKLCVDHCHRSGRVRGLLCTRCNSALGVYERNRHEFNEYLGLR